MPGSHLPLLVVGSVTLRGRDSATLYPPLKVDELGQAGHWVAWHMVLPVRGGSSNTNKAACLSHLANTVGASSDCQSELRETFYSATYPASSEVPRNLFNLLWVLGENWFL